MTSESPELRAISLFLERTFYTHACACVGAQPLTDEINYVVKLVGVTDRVGTIHVIRQFTGLGLLESKKVFDSKTVSFNNKEDASRFVKELTYVGTTTYFDPKDFEPKSFPLCPCAMQRVVEVDENFYEVHEERASSGITHTVTLLGPVGGPYINI